MKKVSRVVKRFFISVYTVVIYISLTIYTYARAGGGESFGDGGFDSGGGTSLDFGGSSYNNSFSGTSSGGDFGTFIVIIIILIVILIVKRRSGKGFGTGNNVDIESGTSTPSHKSQSTDEIKSHLKRLISIDPKFDEQKFKSHSKKVFMSVQDGWTRRDQKVCRAFMAEEIFQSHQMQIDSMKSNKVINKLENIVVGSTAIARIDIDEEFHKIAVKVRASMKDYKVSEDNLEKVIEGSKNQSPPFTEFWIFIRRSNLKTKVKNGIFDRKCPNCGAPIKVDVSGLCKYCDANVVNGDYDWVLSEIVQKSEWEE